MKRGWFATSKTEFNLAAGDIYILLYICNMCIRGYIPYVQNIHVYLYIFLYIVYTSTHTHTSTEWRTKRGGTQPHIEVADRKLRGAMAIKRLPGSTVFPLSASISRPPPLRFHQDDDTGTRVTVMHGSLEEGTGLTRNGTKIYARPTFTYANWRRVGSPDPWRPKDRHN